MFNKECDNPKCNKGEDGGRKKVYVYATSKTGRLPIAYCSRSCELEAKYDRRMVG